MSIQGICFFLCGRWRAYAGLATVAIHSLRKYYSGPITLLVGEDVTEALPMRFPDVDIARMPLADVPKHRSYVSKSQIWKWSPYEDTALIDCDTVCTGQIDELFGAQFTVVKFANWVTTGPMISGRLRQWERVPEAKELLAKCLSHPYSHINTGVASWSRSCPLLAEWERLTVLGCACSFTDEYSCQLIVSGRDDVRFLDDRWNHSATYGSRMDDPSDVRLWHYHHRRMIPGRGKPEAASRYRPHLLAALAENYAGIADWLKTIDPALWELAQ